MVKLPIQRRGEPRPHRFVLVDEDDAIRLGRYCWYLNQRGYAYRQTARSAETPLRTIYLHRDVLGLDPGDGLDVDHINGDKSDNRRANLRVLTRGQNGQNRVCRGGSSRYRGVCWHPGAGKWMARATLDGNKVYLGIYDSELVAARVAANWRAQHMPYSVRGR